MASYLGPRFNPDPEVPGMMVGDPEGSWTHYEEPEQVRQRERTACAGMVRAALPLIEAVICRRESTRCKTTTRQREAADEITRALANAIEARGRS
jgi:hypothetical protein